MENSNHEIMGSCIFMIKKILIMKNGLPRSGHHLIPDFSKKNQKERASHFFLRPTAEFFQILFFGLCLGFEWFSPCYYLEEAGNGRTHYAVFIKR